MERHIANDIVEPPTPLDPAASRAVRSFAALFGDLSEKNVRARVREVYAADVVFHDTLKRVEGIDELEEYLLETARNVVRCEAGVEDAVPSSDGGVYVRWTMTVEFRKLAGKRPTRSIGVTHLRYSPDGQILFHQDYWDSAAGFFDYVPVVGRVLRWIRSRV